MRIPSGPIYSYKKASWLVGFSLIIPLSLLVWQVFPLSDEPIKTLTTPVGHECVRGVFLAELLDLSSDQPLNLNRFDLKRKERELLQYPMIESTFIKKEKGGALYVDATLRTPIAQIGNASNCAIDESGVLFPLAPFLTPRNLPSLILSPSKPYVEPKILSLAKSLIKLFEEESFCTIDLSKVGAPTAGEEEIVILLSDNQVLRVCVDELEEQLLNYTTLKKSMDLSNTTLDFRVPHLAFIKKKETV